MKTTSSHCWHKILPILALTLSLGSISPPAAAAGRDVLAVKPPSPVSASPGADAVVTVRAELTPGYHVNSDTPSDEYLIPLKLTWSGPVEAAAVAYPEPKLERYEFADKPLSVFTADFDIKTTFRIPAKTATGLLTLTGKLRYQACSDRLCLPPRTIPVEAVLDIRH